MLIAFVTSITLLPALLKVLNPPGEPEALGYTSLAPVDRFMERHRIPIIVGTGARGRSAGLPLLYWLQFDFNPINLRSPKVESIATYPRSAQRSERPAPTRSTCSRRSLKDARRGRRAAAASCPRSRAS